MTFEPDAVISNIEEVLTKLYDAGARRSVSPDIGLLCAAPLQVDVCIHDLSAHRGIEGSRKGEGIVNPCSRVLSRMGEGIVNPSSRVLSSQQ